MKHADIKAMMAEVAPVIKEYAASVLSPVLVRLDALEKQIVAMPAPITRDDAKLVILAEIKSVADGLPTTVAAEVEKAVAAIPPAKDGEPGPQGEPGKDGESGRDGADGKDADVEEIAARLIPEVERAVAALPKPQDGKDADPELMRQMVAEEVAKIEPPKGEKGDPGEPGAPGVPGSDADPEVVAAIVTERMSGELAKVHAILEALPEAPELPDVAGMIETAVAAIPKPVDGKSVTVEDLTPLVGELVSAAFAAVPVPKDGVDGKDGLDAVEFLRGSEGHLIVTMSNGTTRDLGAVNGLPGKDGADGLGFEDMDEELADDGRTIIRRYSRGDQVKEFRHRFSVVLDQGVFKDGETYGRGDSVSYGGSVWIARMETTDKPGTSDAWRLSAKKGRDGKDGTLKPPIDPKPLKVG